MALDLSESAAQQRMMSLLKEITPLQRLIISPGMDRAFEIVQRELPDIHIHEYPSGSESEDWIVPNSWAVQSAHMKDRSGQIIATFDDNPLFVAPFSEPISGWFNKQEIEKHLSTRPDRPNAFALEHRHAYNYQLVDWGITLPHNLWQALPEDDYHIEINIQSQPSSMKVGELFVQGQRPETLCICAHIDELCNDDLSGCVAGIELIRHIQSLDTPQYSYQLLLVPEVIGSLFFVHNNPERIQNTIGMFFLETVGAGAQWCLKQALKPDTRLEYLLRTAIEQNDIPFETVDFFGGYGNDERVYAWPPLDIPGVALQRYPFEEYHTSDDTPDIISSHYLWQAVQIGKTLVSLLERDYTPEYTGRLQPWLTRRGLYFDSIYSKEDFHKYNNLLLFNINGQNAIADLAQITELNYQDICDYLDQFAQAGLIKKHNTIWK